MELRHFGDVCVRWSGDSAANMSEAVLHVLGAPATAEEIVEKIGAECTSLRAVSAALSAYDRFIRASRRAWGLRLWEIDEYCGIADAIRARIDARGGQIRVDELIDDMLSTFPDVAESSIKAYLVSLVFITDRATVRRRTDADEMPSPTAAEQGARSVPQRRQRNTVGTACDRRSAARIASIDSSRGGRRAGCGTRAEAAV